MKRAWAIIAIHTFHIALAVGRVAVKLEGFSKPDELSHPFVPARKEALAGFVAGDNGASPATETAIATARGASVDLDGAFAVACVCVEFIKRAIVAAPRIWPLQQVCPNFFGAQILDRVRNPDAWEIRVTPQAIARFDAGHGFGA